MELLDLPDCMLEQVLEHLSYDEKSKQRIVSVFFFRSLRFHIVLCLPPSMFERVHFLSKKILRASNLKTLLIQSIGYTESAKLIELRFWFPCRFVANSMRSVKVCSMWASTKWCVATRICSKRSSRNCHDGNPSDGNCSFISIWKYLTNQNIFDLDSFQKSSAVKALGHFDMHRNPNVNAVDDLHQIHWSESVLFHTGQGLYYKIDYFSVWWMEINENKSNFIEFRSLTKCFTCWTSFRPTKFPIQQRAPNQFFAKNHCVLMKSYRNCVTSHRWPSTISKRKSLQHSKRRTVNCPRVQYSVHRPYNFNVSPHAATQRCIYR